MIDGVQPTLNNDYLLPTSAHTSNWKFQVYQRSPKLNPVTKNMIQKSFYKKHFSSNLHKCIWNNEAVMANSQHKPWLLLRAVELLARLISQQQLMPPWDEPAVSQDGLEVSAQAECVIPEDQGKGKTKAKVDCPQRVYLKARNNRSQRTGHKATCNEILSAFHGVFLH